MYIFIFLYFIRTYKHNIFSLIYACVCIVFELCVCIYLHIYILYILLLRTFYFPHFVKISLKNAFLFYQQIKVFLNSLVYHLRDMAWFINQDFKLSVYFFLCSKGQQQPIRSLSTQASLSIQMSPQASTAVTMTIGRVCNLFNSAMLWIKASWKRMQLSIE